MSKLFVRSIIVLVALAAVAASPPSATDVKAVLEKYRAALPAPEELTVYGLDWVATFEQARQKAAREGRPILLAVVTNSYGNLHSGHC